MRSGQSGARAEHKVKMLFLDRGWQVFSPEGEPSEVDLIVRHRTSRQLYQCQVKSGGHKKRTQTKQNGNVVKRSWRACCTKRAGFQGKYLKYSRDDFDLLCVVDRRTDQIYIVDWPRICDQLGRAPSNLAIDTLERGYREKVWPGWTMADSADASFLASPIRMARENHGPIQLSLFS